MQGKVEDAFLQAEDILFVPTSGAKVVAKAAAKAALSVGTGIAVFAGR